jgi:hypothetical protein
MSVTLNDMAFPDGPAPGGDGTSTDSAAIDGAAEVRAEALDLLKDALHWHLAEARWQAIEHVLITMDAALTVSDLAALAAATADLELAGPLRITRIGATPVVPPPPPIRDRLNRLVYVLGGRMLTPETLAHEGPDAAEMADDGAQH